MRRILFGIGLAAIVGLASAGSYWLGRKHTDPPPQMSAVAPARAGDRQPDGGSPQSPAATAPKAQEKILYYRNPMGLPDTSPTPKKDSMGMDYVPVFDGEDGDGGSLKISLAKVQKLGVRSEPAEMRQMTRTIRAVGTVQADERSLYAVNTKFEGWIEKLDVNTTGQRVRRGEPLMEVYAPELVAVQEEYILALRSQHRLAGASPDVKTSAQQLADAALERLRSWGIPDDQIKRLQRTVTLSRTLTLRAPADGVVMEKMAVEGQRFMPGEPLYRIADLSTVWLLADVFEQDLAAIHEGEMATVKVAAYPGAEFTGTVAFIYPTVAKDTRTVKIRIVVPNPGGQLKTDMFANVELAAPITNGAVVAVPDSALLDSGTRQAVLIDRGDGRFEPREVKIGAKADGFYEVMHGISAGEKVVVGANFLIDAESNIKAALKAFTSPQETENAR